MFGCARVVAGSGIITTSAGVSAGACAGTTGGGFAGHGVHVCGPPGVSAGPGVPVGGVHVSQLDDALEPHENALLLYSAQLFL